MSILEDDLSFKNITNDRMSSDIQLKNATLDQREAEIIDLKEQFRLAKDEHDGLEIAIQELVVSNQQYFDRVSALEYELTTKMSIIEEMSADVSMWNSTCEEKTDENSALNEQLVLSKAEVDELKAVIEGLATNHRENMQQLKVLEDDMSSKINLIDEMITELDKLNSSCDNLKAENIHLVDQVKIFMNECDQFKTIINNLETSNSDYASELEQLTSSNDELLNTVEEFTKSVNAERLRHEKEINEFKMNETDAMSRMTDLFNTEKSNLERELDQVMNMLEAEKKEKAAVVKKLEQMTSHTKALNETVEASIADIDKAMLEIQSKNLLLEEKIAENAYLTHQLDLAQAKSDVSLKMPLETINKTVCAIVADETLEGLRMFNEEKVTEFLDSVESLTKTVIKSWSYNEEEQCETNNMNDEFVAIASVASSSPQLNEGIMMKAVSMLNEAPCQKEHEMETNIDEIDEETEDDIVAQVADDPSDAFVRPEQDGVDNEECKLEEEQLVESSVENITTGSSEAGEYVKEFVEESTKVYHASSAKKEEAAKLELDSNKVAKLSSFLAAAAFASAVKTAPVEKEVEAPVAPTPDRKAESPSTKAKKVWHLFPVWGAGKEPTAENVDNPADSVSQSLDKDFEKEEEEKKKFSHHPTELEDSSKENITTRLMNKDGENSSNKTVSEISTKEAPSSPSNNNGSNVGRLRLLFEHKGK